MLRDVMCSQTFSSGCHLMDLMSTLHSNTDFHTSATVSHRSLLDTVDDMMVC